jgi:hypothetical protein
MDAALGAANNFAQPSDTLFATIPISVTMVLLAARMFCVVLFF